jgi:hypothetical protein
MRNLPGRGQHRQPNFVASERISELALVDTEAFGIYLLSDSGCQAASYKHKDSPANSQRLSKQGQRRKAIVR